MNHRSIVPCLWLDDQAEEAATFYTETFPEGRVMAVSRYPESFDNPGRKPRGSVLTVQFDVAGQPCITIPIHSSTRFTELHPLIS